MNRLFRIALVPALLLQGAAATAQCRSGDCNAGSGEYDYGWCVYKGQFRDGKPDGEGEMRYDTYTYTGHFARGLEDGEGTIAYRDGRKETVIYKAGRKVARPAALAAGAYKPVTGTDPACLSGDCINGQGTYQYPSGNKYVGVFSNRKREGEGSVFFANGEKFSGTWRADLMVSGTYTFANGAVYTGSFDGQGDLRDGKLVKGGIEVPYVAGVAFVPPPRKVVVTRSAAPNPAAASEAAYRPMCMTCHGLGRIHKTISWSEGRTEVRNGIRQDVLGEYNTCSGCNGSGHVNAR